MNDTEAKKNVKKSLELDPDNVDNLNLKGLLLFNSNKYHKALNSYNDALKYRVHNHFFALKNKGRTLIALDKPDEAIDCINIAIRNRMIKTVNYYP